MTPDLPLQGTLGDNSLVETLAAAAQRSAYCAVQIAGNEMTGEIQLANGAIVIADAGDANGRQRAIETIFSLIRLSKAQSGAFRLTPLTNLANADATARLQVSAAIEGAARESSGAAATTPTPAVAPVAVETVPAATPNPVSYTISEPTRPY